VGLPSATGRNQGGLGMQTLLTTDVSARCRSCGLTDSISLPAESVRAYMRGDVMVQEAFPSLSAESRELLLQVFRRNRGGFHWYMCPHCWTTMGEA
jgi:hypothetical protein